jgi:NAD(P)H-flavin reductase
MLTDIEQHSSSSPWLAQSASILEIGAEVPGVATYKLAFNDPQVAKWYHFEPGQFNML